MRFLLNTQFCIPFFLLYHKDNNRNFLYCLICGSVLLGTYQDYVFSPILQVGGAVPSSGQRAVNFCCEVCRFCTEHILSVWDHLQCPSPAAEGRKAQCPAALGLNLRDQISTPNQQTDPWSLRHPSPASTRSTHFIDGGSRLQVGYRLASTSSIWGQKKCHLPHSSVYTVDQITGRTAPLTLNSSRDQRGGGCA